MVVKITDKEQKEIFIIDANPKDYFNIKKQMEDDNASVVVFGQNYGLVVVDKEKIEKIEVL